MESAPQSHETAEVVPSPERLAERAEAAFYRYQNDFHLIPEELSGTLLDVAANRGDFVRHVREKLGNERAVGVEANAGFAASYPEGVVRAHAEKLPFPNESFRTVLAHDFIPIFFGAGPKFPDPATFVREMLRVTEPGGTARFNSERLDASLEELLGKGGPIGETAELRGKYVERVRERASGMRGLLEYLEEVSERGDVEVETVIGRRGGDSTKAIYILRKKG